MKNREEILNQDYLTANDLKELVPTLGKEYCLQIIDLVRAEMEKKGYFVPKTKPRIALTKMVKKKLGL